MEQYLDEEGNVTIYQKKGKRNILHQNPQPKIKNGKLYQNKQIIDTSQICYIMQEDGWILRDDIIWHKPNRIPASVRDRFNNTYEHDHLKTILLFYLDAIKIIEQTVT